MTLKTVSIPRTVHKELKIYCKDNDYKSLNKCIRYLLSDVDEIIFNDDDYGHININIDDDLYLKLSNCRVTPSEPLGSVLLRLIDKSSS